MVLVTGVCPQKFEIVEESYDSRPTCPVSDSDTQTSRTLHVSCMVAPLSCAILLRRSYLLQSFPKKAERHRVPIYGTHDFIVTLPWGAEADCVAPRAVHCRGWRTAHSRRDFCGVFG